VFANPEKTIPIIQSYRLTVPSEMHSQVGGQPDEQVQNPFLRDVTEFGGFNGTRTAVAGPHAIEPVETRRIPRGKVPRHADCFGAPVPNGIEAVGAAYRIADAHGSGPATAVLRLRAVIGRGIDAPRSCGRRIMPPWDDRKCDVCGISLKIYADNVPS
jgi:hypothetical protein